MSTESPIDSLSPRERDCLRLLLTTDLHKQIAYALGISTNTVRGHLKNANRKLGVNSSKRAALLLAEHEAGGPPQKWGDHPSPLPPPGPEQVADVPSARPAPHSGSSSGWLRLPALRAGRSGNDLTAPERTREIVQAMFMAIASIGIVVAALTGFGILAHSWFGQH